MPALGGFSESAWPLQNMRDHGAVSPNIQNPTDAIRRAHVRRKWQVSGPDPFWTFGSAHELGPPATLLSNPARKHEMYKTAERVFWNIPGAFQNAPYPPRP